MAQWDGIGDVEHWGEYFAGRRKSPPKAKLLDTNCEATAWEWAVVILKIDNDRASKFADYVLQNGIGTVVKR